MFSFEVGLFSPQRDGASHWPLLNCVGRTIERRRQPPTLLSAPSGWPPVFCACESGQDLQLPSGHGELMARLKPCRCEGARERGRGRYLPTSIAKEQEANPTHPHTLRHICSLCRTTLIHCQRHDVLPRVSTAVIGTLNRSVGCSTAREEARGRCSVFNPRSHPRAHLAPPSSLPHGLPCHSGPPHQLNCS